MNFPDEYYPLMEIKYRKMLEEQKIIAYKATRQLLNIDPEVVKKEAKKRNLDGEIEEIILVAIFTYFNDAVFFQTDQTLAKLKFLNVSPPVLRWFISFKELHKQYEIISKKGIKIDYLMAFTYIKSYLKTKFDHDLLMNYASTIHDSVTMTELSKEILLLKSKRRNSGENLTRYKNLFEFLLNNQVNQIISLYQKLDQEVRFDITTYYRFSRGKTEFFFLKKLLEECFDYDQNSLSHTEFLSTVYDLVRLVIQDRFIIDETEFLSPRKRIYLSYKSFDAYKAKKIRSLIYPKRRPK